MIYGMKVSSFKFQVSSAEQSPSPRPSPPGEGVASGSRWNCRQLFLSLLTSAATIFIFSGCGGLAPMQRKESNASQTAESIATAQSLAVRKVVEGTPKPTPIVPSQPPNITISGTNNHAEIKVEQARADVQPGYGTVRTGRPNSAVPFDADAGYREEIEVNSGTQQNAHSTEAITEKREVKLPLSVAILIGAVALVLIGVLIRWARKASPAIDAAFTMADGALKARIDAHRASSTKAATPQEALAHQVEINALESERGKLAAQKP